MSNEFTFDKNNDRIVEINDITLYVRDDYRLNRRNVICYSNKLQLYMTLHKLRNVIEDRIIIGNLINKNIFDDIKVIKVKGYF